MLSSTSASLVYVERQHLDTLSAKSYSGSAISARQVTNPAVDRMGTGSQSFGHVPTETTGRSSNENRFASCFHSCLFLYFRRMLRFRFRLACLQRARHLKGVTTERALANTFSEMV